MSECRKGAAGRHSSMGIFDQRKTGRWRSMAISHKGLKRAQNEDRVLDMPERGLWGVADGMGGHDRGEVASEIVIDCLRSEAGTGDDLTAAVLVAHQRICRHPVATESKMGSTVVGLRIQPGSLNFELAWVGDSRAYLLRNGQFKQLTEDHTLVNELLQRGVLSAEEAAAHPEKSVLSRALGRAQEGKLQVERKLGQCRRGDAFILCSDGLYGATTEAAMRAAIQGVWTVDYKTRRLLELAMQGGAPDNVSVILIQL